MTPQELEVEDGGGNLYRQMCHTLGIAPLSAVAKACSWPEAVIAHCPLGANGAQALAHALSCNTVITSLTLRDNNLDDQASPCPGTNDEALSFPVINTSLTQRDNNLNDLASPIPKAHDARLLLAHLHACMSKQIPGRLLSQSRRPR